MKGRKMDGMRTKVRGNDVPGLAQKLHSNTRERVTQGE